MTKSDLYKKQLLTLNEWDQYLLDHSGLPGPRGNIELAQVVADMGTMDQFVRWADIGADSAPTNNPGEFLAFCGVVGGGRLAADGERNLLRDLRRHASDSRWRIREAVAMALQRVGDKNVGLLLREMKKWSRGNLLEKRAAAASLCEPRLLREEQVAKETLELVDEITRSVLKEDDRSSEEFQALKKGLGYCWSVVVAAIPRQGMQTMAKWFATEDKDVRWIMKENLGKNRLARMDAGWVNKSLARLSPK